MTDSATQKQINDLLNEAKSLIGQAQGLLSTSPPSPPPEPPTSDDLVLVSPSDGETLPVPNDGRVEIKWRGPSGAKYDIRVEDLTDPSLRLSGNNCGVNKHYVCRNKYKDNHFLLPVKEGHSYRWWVHIYPSAEWEEARFSMEGEVSLPTPPMPVPPQDKVRGIMLTDAACDKSLEEYRGDDLSKLRSKYDTILSLLDLQKDGTKPSRKYVDWARDKTVLTPLGLKNLKLINEKGFRVHAVLLNSWATKNGYGGQIGSIQNSFISESKLYSSSQLEQEKSFIDDLLEKAPFVDGIMPALEAQHPSSAPFCIEIARYLREDKGYKGAIVFNLIGSAENELEKFNSEMEKYSVLKSSSQNNPDQWTSSDNDIRNSDGMMEVDHTRTDLIQLITGEPGPKGFYLWAKELVGSTSGRMVDVPSEYVVYAMDDDNGGSTPDPDGPNWSNAKLAPEKKGAMLWKPISENDKKLVVLIKWSASKVKRVTLRKEWLSSNFEEGRYTGTYSHGGPHHKSSIYRLRKKGEDYSSPVYLAVELRDSSTYVYKIPSPANRYDQKIVPWFLPSSGSPTNPEPPNPDPPNPEPPSSKKYFGTDGNRITFGNKVAPIVSYTCWPLANRSNSDIDRVLTEAKSMGFNFVSVRTNFLGDRNGNTDYLLSQALAKKMGVVLGFGIYVYPKDLWWEPKQVHSTKGAFNEARAFAKSYKKYPNVIFMADSLDAKLPDDDKISRDLVKGFKAGAPDHLAFVMPKHGGYTTGFSGADFDALHSGHSDGKSSTFVKGLYGKVSKPVYNMESLYYGKHPFNGGTVGASETKKIDEIDAQYGSGVTFGDYDVVVCHADWKLKISTSGAKATAAVGKKMTGYTMFDFDVVVEPPSPPSGKYTKFNHVGWNSDGIVCIDDNVTYKKIYVLTTKTGQSPKHQTIHRLGVSGRGPKRIRLPDDGSQLARKAKKITGVTDIVVGTHNENGFVSIGVPNPERNAWFDFAEDDDHPTGKNYEGIPLFESETEPPPTEPPVEPPTNGGLQGPQYQFSSYTSSSPLYVSITGTDSRATIYKITDPSKEWDRNIVPLLFGTDNSSVSAPERENQFSWKPSGNNKAVVTLGGIFSSIKRVSLRKGYLEPEFEQGTYIGNSNGGTVDPPNPDPNPDPKAVFLIGPSSWDHGHPSYQFPVTANYHYEAGGKTQGSGRHFRVVPWSKNERYSLSQQKKFCEDSLRMGFYGLNFDIERQLWDTKGYLAEFMKTCLASGLKGVACPKASLGELSGKPHADVGTMDRDKFCSFLVSIGYQAIMPWAYGGYDTHVRSFEKCREYWSHYNICMLHDSFRDNNKGYKGYYEWPKLINWAKSKSPTPLLGMFEQKSAIDWRGKVFFNQTIAELSDMYK